MNELDSIATTSPSTVTEASSGLEQQNIQSLSPAEPPLYPARLCPSAFINQTLVPERNIIGSILVKGMRQTIPVGTAEYEGKSVLKFLMIDPNERINRSYYYGLSDLAYGTSRPLDWTHIVIGPEGSVEAVFETATPAEVAQLDAIPQEIAEATTEKIIVINEKLPPNKPSQAPSDKRTRVFRTSSLTRPTSEPSFKVGELIGGTGLLITLDILEYERILSPQGRKGVNLGLIGTLSYLAPSTPTHLILISAPFSIGRQLVSTSADSTKIKGIEQNSLGNKILGTIGGIITTSGVVATTGGVSVYEQAAIHLQNQMGRTLYSFEISVQSTMQNLLGSARQYWNQAATFASTGAAWVASAWNIARPILRQAATTAAKQAGPELLESAGIALLDGPEPGPADVAGAVKAAIALGTGFLILGAGLQIAYQNIPSYPDSQTKSKDEQN